MGNETGLAVRGQTAAQEQAIATVDRIAGGAMALLQSGDSFATELALARAMNDMRVALTPDLVAPLMELANSDLGFRTDRDKGSGKPPYSAEVVRDVFIEAKLRGFRALGNEFNIIQGRFYAAKNGLRRKVQSWPGLTDLRESYDPPKLSAGGNGAIVRCIATWKRDGIAESIEVSVPVKGDATAVDMILGKAERKFLRRIHDRLGGVVTPDGDAGEDALERPTFVTAPPMPVPPPVKSKETAAAVDAGRKHADAAAKADAENVAAIEAHLVPVARDPFDALDGKMPEPAKTIDITAQFTEPTIDDVGPKVPDRAAAGFAARMKSATATVELSGIGDEIRGAIKAGSVNDTERAELLRVIRVESERVHAKLAPGSYPGDEIK